MSYTIANIKDDLSSNLHGTSLNKIQGINILIDRAVRQLLLDVDPKESIRTSQLTNAIYSDVFDYQLPSDVKGDKILDISQQTGREVGDSFAKNYTEFFDRSKNNNTFVIKNNSGVKSLRLSKSIEAGIVLNTADSLTDNGTWSATSDATNLTQDKLQFVSGIASLNFDLSGASTSGYIENSTMTEVDLSEHEEISSLFMWAYLPNSSAITNLDLRWGSSVTEYWNATVTSQHDSTSFQDGWNLLRFDWNGATKTGSPSSSAIDTLRATITYDGVADTDIRIDNIVSRKGKIFDITYYSKFLFRSSAGVWAEKVANDTDIINLDTDSYNLLLDKVTEFATRQLQGSDSSFDYQTFRNDYKEGIAKYKRTYKTEIIKSQSSYSAPIRRNGLR